MSKPLISAIIPAYNVSEYITECVESLLNQSYPKIEILVFNDGSTDGTRKKLDKLVSYSNVAVFNSQENRGVSYARNFLFNEAQGEYIMLQDSDDKSLRTRAAANLKFMQESDFKFVACNIQTSEQRIYKYSDKDEIFVALKQFLCHKPLGGASSFFHRDILDSGIRYDERLLAGEDVLFDIEVQSKFPLQMRGLPIETPLYWYRRLETSLTSIRSEKDLTPQKVMDRRNKKIKRLMSKVLLNNKDRIMSYLEENPNLKYNEVMNLYNPKEEQDGSSE